MTPSISCFYYDYNSELYYFTFIKYEKFIIIYLNMKSVIFINQVMEHINQYMAHGLKDIIKISLE